MGAAFDGTRHSTDRGGTIFKPVLNSLPGILWISASLFSWVCLPMPVYAQAPPGTTNRVYVLGSSYSLDAVPDLLDGAPARTTYCGKSLQYIFDNPLIPCDEASTVWPAALQEPATATAYDHIVFQPVPDASSTKQQDVDAITYWLALPLQSGANSVIHPTWPRPEDWEAVHHDPAPDNLRTNRSRAYYFELIEDLRSLHPTRRFVSDRINDMLDAIYHDIENGDGPFTDFNVLFRDRSGHLDVTGQTLAHNAVRQAVGQPIGNDVSPDGLAEEVMDYLMAIVLAHPPLPADLDWDAIADEVDNCPAVPNVDQADGDADAVGDACDNCPATPFPDQTDFDGDGYGNVCDVGAFLADADNSSRVDGFDLDWLARAFGTTCWEAAYEARVDFSRDCIVDGEDLAVLAQHFGAEVIAP